MHFTIQIDFFTAWSCWGVWGAEPCGWLSSIWCTAGEQRASVWWIASTGNVSFMLPEPVRSGIGRGDVGFTEPGCELADFGGPFASSVKQTIGSTLSMELRRGLCCGRSQSTVLPVSWIPSYASAMWVTNPGPNARPVMPCAGSLWRWSYSTIAATSSNPCMVMPWNP